MSASCNDRPILRVAVSAVDGRDESRLQMALAEIAGQDSRLSINTQQQGRAYSVAGKAESDLESACDRLRDKYHLAINVGPPEAILIETIRTQA